MSQPAAENELLIGILASCGVRRWLPCKVSTLVFTQSAWQPDTG